MVNESSFSKLVNRKRVGLYTLRNPNGMHVQITNYGAKIVSLYAPDSNGNFADVVLGFSTLEEWIQKETYFNAVIGRYANRIKGGKFTLDGQTYNLATNNGTNHLHGGNVGFNEKVWEVVGQTAYSVSLHYRSTDGEEGYPGTVDTYVTYRLTRDNALSISYEAKTDKPTFLGLTNHAYFNLKGEGEGDIRDHILQINADTYTPFDDTACPTGEILSVDGTDMDFRTPIKIADRIDKSFFEAGKGIDNNWVLRKTDKKEPELAARLSAGNRSMEVWTTLPGLQVYTGNWIEKNIGKSDKAYAPQTAICLEAQNFPNSPNISSFPSAILRPGEIYFEQCIYKFV
ncbi:MAG: galactose mutarotase [Paludibacter sp.]|nr:galactose mutarotase [Bacteroidales bacterium]MCM1068549.1 galactose mutarotase [Prevotella sp.]MCM1353213.1 galactose mutarotase [Bacteroides sp.]MCM1442379.1 galactose mutarotase [Muribaculum sp.]MCM1481198.1 galactose mutarotase [Paludibacter sp.]